MIRLKFRLPDGKNNIQELPATSSISSVRQILSKNLFSNISPALIGLKIGYPPTLIENENTDLIALGVCDGDTLIVEIKKEDPSKRALPKIVGGIDLSELMAQKPDKNGLIMLRRIILADDSCLFNAVGRAVNKDKGEYSYALRQIIANVVASNPNFYNKAVLERSNEEYIYWIKQKNSWGGGIEINILTEYYKIEICAIDVSTLTPYFFGSEKNYEKRIYLCFDGVHYDYLAKNIMEEMEPESDITVFDTKDEISLKGALSVTYDLHQKRKFTDTSNFKLRCKICFEGLKGEKEALEHGRSTGHANFEEFHQLCQF